MDLNHLYFQHQLSLMRAASAPDCQARAGHHAEAHGLASRISRFQQGSKAGAAASWGTLSPAGASCGAGQ